MMQLVEAGRSRVMLHMSSMHFSNDNNPSSRTVALVFTQALTKMTARNLSGSKGRLVRDAYNLTLICVPTV
jgi:hypothetical protein